MALVAAVVWPNERRLLIEADLDGSTLGPRFAGSVSPEPNIMHLATECRHDVLDDAVLRQTQKLPFGVDLVVGGYAPAISLRSIRELIPRLDAISAEMPRTDLLFDMGRLRSGDTSAELANAMDVVFLAVTPVFENLEPLLRRATELAALKCSVVVIAVGSGDYDAAAIDAEIRARSNGKVIVGGEVAFDARTASGWNDGRVSGDPRQVKRLLRREMTRSVRSIVSSLIAVSPPAEPAARPGSAADATADTVVDLRSGRGGDV